MFASLCVLDGGAEPRISESPLVLKAQWTRFVWPTDQNPNDNLPTPDTNTEQRVKFEPKCSSCCIICIWEWPRCLRGVISLMKGMIGEIKLIRNQQWEITERFRLTRTSLLHLNGTLEARRWCFFVFFVWCIFPLESLATFGISWLEFVSCVEHNSCMDS